MKVTVKESTLVKPMEETPKGGLWLSNLDLVMPAAFHSRSVYFFRHDGSANFFDAAVLKAALSKALVYFYPYAGRLRKDDNGRIEIDCNNEGVVFVEAECDGTVDDLGGGFNPSDGVSLIPKVDYSQGISTIPLSLLQLTRFKCGGVSLGVASEHHAADGISGLHYINTWSAIARGVTTITPPIIDRRILSARDPPRPQFPHIEYQLPPSLKASLDITDTSLRLFRFSRDQINALKEKCRHGGDDDDGGKKRRHYTTYETVAGHAWRTACLARRLPGDQESKLQLPVDGRPRLRPPLSPHFFGNGIFYATAVASCGEIVSSPLKFAVERVHEAAARMDDEYLRSALDYLEVHRPTSQGVVRGGSNVNCPNIGMTSWARLPFYEADFGWGKPVFARPGKSLFEGKSYVFADPENDGGVLFAITLLKPHMELFQKLIYDI